MLTAPLPPALEEALARLLGDGRGGADRLAGRRADLTRRYRGDSQSGPVARSREDVLAYAAARLPATYAAARCSLGELARRAPSLEPRSQLDLGSGPGTCVWAARETWPGLVEATAIEVEPEMRRLAVQLGGREPAAGALPGAVPVGNFDLVTIGYVLGELSERAAGATVAAAWAATTGALVVVQPGTPAGYRRVLAARTQLLALGAAVAAPCPHDRACPLADTGGDWCHFAVRVARSRAHRAAKEAELGHEDEKFSYLAVTRRAPERAGARVLRHPQVRPGHVVLELCAADGLRQETISRRAGDRYRLARKVDWGGSLPLEPAEQGDAQQ